jgi:hypothetical protein
LLTTTQVSITAKAFLPVNQPWEQGFDPYNSKTLFAFYRAFSASLTWNDQVGSEVGITRYTERYTDF